MMPQSDAGVKSPLIAYDRVVKKWEPTRLTPKHRQILALAAQGMKYAEIGSLCQCTTQLVVMLAASQKGKEFLAHVEEQMDIRLRSLYSKSIDAIEDQLTTGSGENKLKAAKLQMQAIGKLNNQAEDAETAEDVIARIMQLNVNVQVNQNGGSSGPGDRRTYESTSPNLDSQ